MNSYRRNSGWRGLAVAALAIIAVLLLDAASGGALRGAARGAGSALWSAGSRAADALGASGYFSSKRSLAAENASLKAELAGLRLQAALNGALADENDALRSLAGLAARERGLTAPIVSSLSASPYGTFSIGAGAADGAGAGSIVEAADAGGNGIVVGRIASAAAHESLVKELFAPGTDTAVAIRGASAVAAGQGGENARARVPKGIAVAAGDPVFAPSLGQRLVGVVAAVRSDSAGAYQELVIGLPINVAALRFVYVVSR